MNKENKSLIRNRIQEVGKILQSKLQPIANHPIRNAYAHLYSSIKDKMKKSCFECSDEEVSQILQILKDHLENEN